MDKVTAEKGYAGPVVVCSVSYEPIAGHRASTPLVKYLSEGRELEMVARTGRRHASAGAVQDVGCERARKPSDRGQPVRSNCASFNGC